MFRHAIAIGALFALCISATAAHAAVFCVGTPTALQSALDTASRNAQDNTIKVRAGTYLTPDGGFIYSHISHGGNLLIEGGWSDPALTAIDGGDEHALLLLFSFGSNPDTDIIVRYFDLYDGISQDGLSPIAIGAEAGGARIENCRIRYNFALVPNTQIVQLSSEEGDVYFLDNVVADNTARYGQWLMLLNSSSRAFVNNNTITANLFGTSADFVDGLLGVNVSELSNNIIWGNTAGYPAIWSDGSAPLLVDNDIDFIGAQIDPASHGNINANPRFVDAANRRLDRNSPACDAGDPNPPGTTRSIDLDGNPRAIRTVDMGAYERQGSCR
jgi:hypothetical protein